MEAVSPPFKLSCILRLPACLRKRKGGGKKKQEKEKDQGGKLFTLDYAVLMAGFYWLGKGELGGKWLSLWPSHHTRRVHQSQTK